MLAMQIASAAKLAKLLPSARSKACIRHQGYPRRPRHHHPRSGRLARSKAAQGPSQHLAPAVATALTRTQQPGKYLAVHAPELAIKPRLQILRRYRRSLLLRLEHPHRSTLEDHVHRSSRMGIHRSIIMRFGITNCDIHISRLPITRALSRAHLARRAGGREN